MSFPKRGKSFHPAGTEGGVRGSFAAGIADALHRSLGGSRARIKVAAGWTGASERTVKNWFAGAYGPSGEHLVELLRHSDEVLQAVLQLSGRENVIIAAQIKNAERVVEELLESIRRIQIN